MNEKEESKRKDWLRVNRQIRVSQVRVVFEKQELGILQTYEALKLAEEKGLDLVEISPRSFPPVCRIMDYGKYKYEQSKKKPQSKKLELKEIKFRPKTEQHDMDFKVKHVRTFLEEGNKVRLSVVFRGREIVHPQVGYAVLEKVINATSDISAVEVEAKLEGKQMFLILAPRK